MFAGFLAGIAALAVSSCAYDPYYSGGTSYSGGYGSGYGYGGSNFSTSFFVSTGSPRWGYDPYAGAYYDYTRRCYYDPYLVRLLPGWIQASIRIRRAPPPWLESVVVGLSRLQAAYGATISRTTRTGLPAIRGWEGIGHEMSEPLPKAGTSVFRPCTSETNVLIPGVEVSQEGTGTRKSF